MKKILITLAALLAATHVPCFAQARVSSSALEASHVLSTVPTRLLHLQGYNAKGSAQFIQLFDATSVPGDATAEVSTFDTTGLVAASLGNKYFLINAPSGAFYVWFNLDAGGVDPAPGGTGVSVAISTGNTAGQIATAVASAVDARAEFVSSAVSNVVTITNASTGAVTDIAAGNSGGAVAVTVQGITAAVPVLTLTAAASSNFSLSVPGGIPFGPGLVVCNSSTAATKTAGSADCFFTAVLSR